MSDIDFDAMSKYFESDEFFDEPPAGQTLTGEALRESTRELLTWAGAGRPNLGHKHAQGTGNSPRRQLRLPKDINDRLDDYAKASGQTASAIMRDALIEYLDAHAA